MISVTLKGVEFNSFEITLAMLCSVIGNEALRFQFLTESDRLSEQEKERYQYMVKIGKPG